MQNYIFLKRISIALLILSIYYCIPGYGAGTDTVRICAYNVLDYPGSTSATRNPYFRTVVNYIKPDILIAGEMTSQSGMDQFQSSVMNYYQAGLYSAVPFNDGPDTDPGLFYKPTKVTFVRASYIPTALRNIGEYVVALNGTTDTLRIYAVHYKASQGYESDRLAEATILRNYLNTLPAGSKFIVVGDYNTYTSTEPCLAKMSEDETNNNGRSKDPLNSVGTWHDGSAFASIHTQSPRTANLGDGGATGGLDDRFDLIYTSYTSLDSNILVSSYKAIGNDGNHLNSALNILPNSLYPDSVALGVYYASDHLPVVCNFVFGQSAPITAFSLVSPSSGVSSQAISGTLVWNRAPNAATYDVYLDTINPPSTIISANRTDTSYAYSSLKYGKTYYWKVKAKNGIGTLDAINSPFNFTTVYPVFSVAPGTVSFSSGYIGSNKLDSLTVSSTGTATLSVDSVKSDNARFTISPASASIAVSGSRKFYVTFTPAAIASQNANIRFYHNATGSPSTVTASGSGIQLAIASSAIGVGTITPSGTVNVNYGASQSFTFAPSTGHHTDSVLIDGVNGGVISNYSFNNLTANHTIAAYFSADRFTITASSGSNGSISPAGTVSVSYGDSAVFAVTPDPTYFVSDVVVDGHSVGAVSSYKFSNITSNHTIVASFTINGYTITASSGPNGTINPSGPISLPLGVDTTFVFSPNTGFHVDSIFVDNAYAGAAGSYTFLNVSASHTINVKFAVNMYTITASPGPHGSIVPAGSSTVAYGADTTYTITPNTGYSIDSLFIDGNSVTVASSYKFTNVTASHTIAATFKISTYTITASAGSNGSVNPSGAIGVTYGVDTTIVITPSTGYHIDSLLIDGVSAAAVSPYHFLNITANHTLRAVFRINAYTITATTGSHGTITPAGASNISYGSDTTFTITPDTGYHIDSVLVDGANIGMATSYRFLNVTDNHIIAASFSINMYSLTVNSNSGGTVLKTPDLANYSYGTSVAIKAIPDSRYAFMGWTGDVMSPQDSITLLMNSAKSVTATFQKVGIFKISSSTVAFNEVLIGTSKKDSIVVTNAGAKTITIVSVLSDNSEFSIAPVPDSIVPGQHATFYITYTPSIAGQANGNIIFTHNGISGVDSITVSGHGSLLSLNVTLQARWNMISNPVTTANDSVLQVYPGGSFSYAYSFNPSSGYVSESRLVNGKGYWQKFSVGSTVAVTGLLRARDTITVSEGWNMIGSISTGVPASSIQQIGATIVSQVFGYSQGYHAADTIQPGKAYWIKADGAGKIVLSAASAPLAAKTRILPPKLETDKSITIRDGAGNTQSLYFGDPTGGSVSSGQYDLPPVPPAGVFDARFESQRFMEAYAAGTTVAKQFRVIFSSAVYPVTVTLNTTGTENEQISFTTITGGKLGNVKTGGKSIVITSPGISSFMVNIQPVPKEYVLHQNYPNPFNPVSTIQYELPVASRAILKIYDVLGREVETLVDNGAQEAGMHQAAFDGSNFASGVYFYRLEAASAADAGNSFTQLKKMLLVK